MDTVQVSGSEISPVIGANYAYWNLGKTLITCLLLLAGFSIESVFAADNVVAENSEPKLSTSQNLKTSSIESPLNSQSNINLRQRLLASKKPNNVGDSLTAKVDWKTFSGSLATENFLLESEEKFQNNYGLEKHLFADHIINTDLHLKNKLQNQDNLLSPDKPSQIISQTDSSSSEDEIEELRRQFLIEPILTRGVPLKSSPGSSAGSPSAYGASAGQAYIGGGLYFPFDKSKDRNDGSMSVGFGLGNPFDSVGMEVNIDITSVGGGPGFDFGDSGAVGFKLHRYLGGATIAAIGWSNPIKWGDVNLAENTMYGVITRVFFLQPDNPDNSLPLTVSVGLGNGDFRSKGAIVANENPLNLFASLGWTILPQFSLISSWTGNTFNVGGSFIPFRSQPLIFNVVIADITENLDTGSGLSISGGYSFEF
ncbi:hypothetical protein [Nodularia chucula]|uniref:hypothetical protein n=1 Tax=Nodularia chucula TaxID=3093667 RepID=UPI0039C6FC0D